MPKTIAIIPIHFNTRRYENIHAIQEWKKYTATYRNLFTILFLYRIPFKRTRTYYIYDTSISALHSSRQRSAAIQSKGNRAQSSAADWQLVQRNNIEPTRFPRNNGVSPRRCYNNDTAISLGYMFILVDWIIREKLCWTQKKEGGSSSSSDCNE